MAIYSRQKITAVIWRWFMRSARLRLRVNARGRNQVRRLRRLHRSAAETRNAPHRTGKLLSARAAIFFTGVICVICGYYTDENRRHSEITRAAREGLHGLDRSKNSST